MRAQHMECRERCLWSGEFCQGPLWRK